MAIAYQTETTGTGGINSLASSSTWTAGYEWYLVTVSTMSPIPHDIRHDGVVQIGTSPTANTEIRHYLVACEDGTNWPDVFDGTASAETVTSEGVRDGFAKLACISRVDATTSNRDYPYDFSAAQVFGGSLPKKYIHFVAHNCSPAALNSTAGNQKYRYTPQTP